MLLFAWFKIRSCIEYQMKECKKFKNVKFSRKFLPTLIPFIVLNQNKNAHEKRDGNHDAWHGKLINRKGDKGAKRKT